MEKPPLLSLENIPNFFELKEEGDLERKDFKLYRR